MPDGWRLRTPETIRWLVLVGLFLVMVLRIAATYTVFSDTSDEQMHISAGVEVYHFQRYTLDWQHPPLARLTLGLLPYALAPNVVANEHLALSGPAREQPDAYWKVLTLGRIGNLLFVPLLLVYVYRWSAELYGPRAGVIAVALVSFSPNVLAHASLATTDFPVAATMVGAAYHLYRWARQPRAGRAIWAGVLSGAAMLTKFSAGGYVPLMLIAYAAILQGKTIAAGRPDRAASATTMVRGAALIALLTAVTVWAGYGFDLRRLATPEDRPHEGVDRVFAPGTALIEPDTSSSRMSPCRPGPSSTACAPHGGTPAPDTLFSTTAGSSSSSWVNSNPAEGGGITSRSRWPRNRPCRFCY